MKKYWIISILLTIFILTLLTFYRYKILRETKISQQLSNPVQKLIQEGSLLRDYQEIPGVDNSYLVIYIKPGYTFNTWDYSCPGFMLQDSIIGEYHLALVQDNKIINDLVIPLSSVSQAYQTDGKLELIYKNKFTGNGLGEVNIEDRVVQKLIEFKDLTGDGQPYEFLLTTTGGGCGFNESIVGAYDPEENQAILYSDWIMRFQPDENGESYYLFECGDHGNEIRQEARYKYDANLKKFVKYWELSTSCI